MKKRNLLFFIMIVTAFILGSCATSKFMLDPDVPSTPKKALLTGLTIGMEKEDNGNREISLLEIAGNIMENLELDDFGYNAEAAIKDFLGANGFDVITDASLAKKNDLPTNTGAALTALGYLVHPATSAYTSNYFLGLALGFNKKEHMQKVKGDSDISYFVYSDLRISKAQTFLFFGGYPQVSFTTAIVDENGEVVLEARAFGKGNTAFLGPDMSQENLTVAIGNAIDNLESLAN